MKHTQAVFAGQAHDVAVQLACEFISCWMCPNSRNNLVSVSNRIVTFVIPVFIAIIRSVYRGCVVADRRAR